MRRERKYVLAEQRRASVEGVLRRSLLGFTEQYAPRSVNNIYLDTLGFAAVLENLAGIGKRTKTRIRWYGAQDRISKPVLELKRRHGSTGDKLNYKLEELPPLSELTASSLRGSLDQKGLPIDLLNQLATLFPVLFNYYERSYFISADGKIRATIDESIACRAFRNIGGNQPKNWFRSNQIIVEVKYAIEEERSVRPLSQALGRPTKHSKYLTAVERIFA